MFISSNVKVGENTVVFQHITIGRKEIPAIGKQCFIGACAIIISNVKIGNNCRIGVETIVTKKYT